MPDPARPGEGPFRRVQPRFSLYLWFGSRADRSSRGPHHRWRGILFAMGGTAFATVGWFITADGLPRGAGQSLVDYANDHPGHLIGPNMAGFLLSTIGALVLSAALIRARAVSVPAVIIYVVLTLVQFTGLPSRTMDFLQNRDDAAPDRVRGSHLAPRA